MPKPIFIIQIPDTTEQEDFVRHQKYLEGKFPDYYILIHSAPIEMVQFKMFYEKDFDEIKYEELKQLVLNQFKKIKNKNSTKFVRNTPKK